MKEGSVHAAKNGAAEPLPADEMDIGLLQRSTTMSVVTATDGTTAMPNCVYVIPPGKFLASANGQLRLTDAEEHRGKRVAVDFFFRTLAETPGAQALAVVLSGAGGDGALGLKEMPAKLAAYVCLRRPAGGRRKTARRVLTLASITIW